MYKILKNTIEMDDYSVQKLSNLQPPEPFEWNTVEGTELNVSDCIGGKGKIEVKGNTKQKQLSGKNLLPIVKGLNFTKNGITITVDEDNVITINGTCTTDNTVLTIFDEFDLQAGTYFANFIYLSGSMQNNTNYTRLHFADENWANQLYRLLAMSNGTSSPLVLSDGVHYKNRIIRLNAGEIFNNYKFKVQITKTASDFDYEEYCGGQPSPNPDYPQEIKVVTGNNVIKQVGKNLANSYRNIWYSTNSNAFTSINNFRSCMAKVKPNTTYVISKKNISNRYVVITSSEKIEPDVPIRRIIVAKTNPNYTEYSFTTQADENYVFFGYYSGSNEEEIELAEEEIMIEEDSTPTTYEQYQEKNYNLNLSNIELCKIGDYQDILFKNIVGDENYNAELEEGAWYKKEIINKRTLNSSEIAIANNDSYDNITYASFGKDSNDYVYNTVSGKKAFSNVMIYDKSSFSPGWDNSEKIGFLFSNATSKYYWYGVEKGTSLEQIQSKLNGALLYTVRATAKYTQITNPTLISQLEALRKAKWFKGVNHWWTETNNLEPVLKGTYRQAINE